MPSEGLGQPGETSDRVARGFEALVDEEPLLSRPPGAQGPGTELARLDVLEQRVRVTMDRLTELVEAQLPEAVDGLRADFEQLRSDLHQNAETVLAQATQQLADERRQLRSQIAMTVGAANRWFVRTRDQLFERLDYIASVAVDAQAREEVAAAATALSPTAFPELEAVPESAPPEEQPEQPDVALEWDVEEPSPIPEVEQPPAEEPYVPPAAPVEAAETVDPMPMSVVLDAPELETLVAPLRDDIQELQGEVSAMAEAMFQLREDVERLSQRIPLRPPAARLAPRQLDAIVQAVQEALPARTAARTPPAPRAPAATQGRTATKAATAKSTRAGAVRKTGTARKAATSATRGTTATRATTAARATKAAKATRATKVTKAAKAVKRAAAASAARRPLLGRTRARS